MFYRLPLCLVLICGCDQGESLRKKALSVPDENRDAISKRGYVICEEVGQGGDARAFLVSKNCDEGTEKQIAKCSLRNEVEKFKDEFRIMNEIYVIDPLRFPKPIDLISIDNVSCIFMDRYGSDLEKKRRTHDTRFSLITIATIGLYMMDTLDKFHKAGYVHMDPHPGNWLFDFGPLNKKLRLIDFGHTKEVSIEGQWKDLFHLIIGLRFLEIGDDAYMYPWDMHAQRPGIHLCKNGVSREICDMLQVAAAPRDGDLQALEQDIRTRLLSILKSRGISYSDEIRWMFCITLISLLFVVSFSREYRACEEIGSGGDGKVYFISKNCTEDASTLNKIAKCSFNKENHADVYGREYNIMKAAHDFDPTKFPKPLGIIFEETYSCLIVEKYGETLSRVRKDTGAAFSLTTIATIGLNMLDAIETFHRAGYAHMDAHPENWLFVDENDTLLLIDFTHARSVSSEGRWKDLFQVLLGLRFLQKGDDALMYPWDMHAQRAGPDMCKDGVSKEICQMLQAAAVPIDGDIDQLYLDTKRTLNTILAGNGMAYSSKIVWDESHRLNTSPF